ncbi:RhoGAP-domain-containing protein [Microstroma glucosiphilum]|uniref:RhoGAP-domain-containing protein n=1 Tax=Pseudomicrostroma glucosiphilum TaxID=1684307 RepID=A0A316UAR7_9BASI|nr:RhoGAP-domain-containing protein [Pseudomicrostroma glucosiphilum]PWN22306.1 RhoGAP-domain-containing protein [Pseudomicrostroma glucosiphilum]
MGEPAAAPLAQTDSLLDSQPEASTSGVPGWQTSTPVPHEQDEEVDQSEEVGDVLCGGCGKLINEDSAQGGVIHFATQLWHLECFRCAKCSQPVSTDRDDILLLSDGHPICASCNYSCQICGLPILEEAIMTGDESYHATCFTCRSCKEPIKELVFAKTSQGIYCMPCHSERVARSRRHSEARKKSGKHRDGSTRRARQPTDGSQSTDKATNADDTATHSQLPPSEPSAASIATSASLASTTEGTRAQDSEVSQHSDQTLHPLLPGHTENGTGEASLPSRAVTPSSELPTTPQMPSPPLGTHLTSLQSQSQSQLRSPFSSSPAQNYSRPVPPSAGATSMSRGVSSSANHQEPSTSTASPPSRLSAADSTRKRESPLPATPIGASAGLTTAGAPPNGMGDDHHSQQGSVQHVPVIRRSSDSDAKDAVAALRSITASESAPSHASPSTRPGSAAAIKVERASSSQGFGADGRITPTPTVSGTANYERILGSPLRHSSSPAAAIQESPVLPRSPSGLLPRASHFSSSSEDDAESRERSATAPVKRASRLSHMELSSQDPAIPKRLDGLSPEPALAETFSFYDADFANLIDSISDNDLERTASQMSSPVLVDDASSPFADGRAQRRSHGQVELSSTDETQMVTSQSAASMMTIQARMRESMSQARDGQVSMETAFIEMVLQELDDTRNRMKALRSKYDQLKRASQYAVQGIDYARVEYDAQRQARSDAEMEMLKLKERLAEQASKLAALAHSEKQQETLDQRSKDIKTSLQDMTKSLTKLTVERDLKAAEVAELIAVQEGRSQLPSGPDASSNGEAEKLLQSRLSLRLDDVKARYRQDIEHLTDQRNELLIEIEDLRQSRDVYLEETETLNTRNEELNTLLSRLTAKVESMSLADQSSSVSSRQSSRSVQAGPGAGAGKSSSGFGFGFSTRGGRGHAVSPSIASSRDGFTGGSSAGYHSAADPEPTTSGPAPSRGAMNLPPQAAAQTRAEAVALASLASSSGASLPLAPSNSAQGGANNKKFKWMKPISSSKNSNPQGLAGPPVSPSPPMPPPKNGHHGHTSSASLQPSLFSSQREKELISHEQIVREHVFVPFHVLRPTRCFACQKNMWGQSEVRCASCGQVCHSKCLSSLPISCTQPYLGRADELGSEPAGPSMFGRSLVEQAAAEGRDIPLVVEKCIQAVERNGMDYEGIYRKSGGSSQLRVITQLFERGSHFDLDDVERFNDVSAVTSVLKNYFRELPEPLMTYELHEGFIKCIEQFKTSKTNERPSSSAGESGPLASGSAGPENGKVEDAKLQKMREMVGQLPRAHLETLKLLIGHLNQVARRSDENRMTARNLGVVFGPTLMKSPDASKEFSEMGGKSLTVEYLTERYQDVFA